MHHLDADLAYTEKACRQMHKNATGSIKQILEATSLKTAALLPPTTISKTIQIRRTRYAGHCWRSKDKLISDVPLWALSQGRASVGQPDWTYLQQPFKDTVCSVEDLLEAMDDRDGWREKIRVIHVCSTTRWWSWFLVCHKRNLKSSFGTIICNSS